MRSIGEGPGRIYNPSRRDGLRDCGCVCPTLEAFMGTGGGNVPVVNDGMIRRLTVVECERLQGFTDNFSLLPGQRSDSARYKSLGNSMAVPVMLWVGSRIHELDTNLIGG